MLGLNIVNDMLNILKINFWKLYSIGTCGMMDILDLRSCSPMSAMTRPSITMLPTAASIIRKSANDRDDLPAPVLPTIPICNHITKIIVWIPEKLKIYFILRKKVLI